MGKKRKLLQKRVGCESIIEEDSSQEQNSLQRTEKEVIFANEVLYGICFVPEDTSKTRIQLEEYPYCYYNNVELYKEVTAGEVTAGEVTAGEVIAGEVTAGKNRDGALVMGECVVVGTYDRIYEVFNGDEVIEGYTIEVHAAPRPDYVDYVYECWE